MQVTKKELPKSQVELIVELSLDEFKPYIEKGAQKVSEGVNIEGFRKGKVPTDVLKQKIGEMTILEESARLVINKTIDEVIEKNTMGRQAVGQPQVNITKLAPNNPLEYKVTFSLLPEIALGEYKNLNIKVEEIKVDDKEIEKALGDLQEMRASEVIADREIRTGDKVIVDIKMSRDKVSVEHGDHKDVTILIGKNYFVPGFDDKITGAKKDEECQFELIYPEDHHQKDLAGKLVDFNVKIKEVYNRELPKLDDKFAEFFKLKSLEELKTNLRESLLHEKKHQAEHKNESELISRIVENTKFGDFPDEIIQSEARNMMMELEQSVVRQGGKFEDYLSHLKKTREELMLELMPNAVKRVKSALIIRELAIVEKITPTEKEIDDKIEELKKQYKDNEQIIKMLGEPNYRHYLNNILTNEKVIAKLKEWNYADTGSKQKS